MYRLMNGWIKGKIERRKENDFRNWCDMNWMFQELQEQLQEYHGFDDCHPDN